jgi:hypothetical protein
MLMFEVSLDLSLPVPIGNIHTLGLGDGWMNGLPGSTLQTYM